MLEWDKTEFIECLEVIPEDFEEDVHGPFSVFRVKKDGLELELTVFPYEDDVRFRIFKDGSKEPFFKYQIMDCKSAKFINEKKYNFEQLEFVNKADMKIVVSVKPKIKLYINEDL